MSRGAGRVRTVSVRVTANISDLEKKMRAVSAKMKKVGQEIQTTGMAMTKTFTAPAVAAATALTKLTHSTMDYADKIDKMNVRTGLGTDRLQELQYVTDQLGVSFDSIEKSVTYLTRRMNSAEKGTGDYYEAFQRLGIEMKKDGQYRAIGDIYEETIHKLANMTDTTEQSMLAVKLFGTQANELMPILRAGGTELERLTERFRALGLGLSAEQIIKFVQFKDRISELGMRFKRAGADIAFKFLPVFEKLAYFGENKILPVIQKLGNFFENLDNRVLITGTKFAALLAAIGPILVILGGLTTALAGVSIKMVAVAGAITMGTAVLVSFAKKNEGVRDSIKSVWEGIQTTIQGVMSFWDKFGKHILEVTGYVMDNIANRIRTRLNVAGNLFSAFGNLLSGNWKGLWGNIVNIATSAASNLLVTWGNIVSGILALFQKMSSLLLDGIFKKITVGIESALNRVIGGINKLFAALGMKRIGAVSIDVVPSQAIGDLRKQIDDIVNKFRGGEKFTFGDATNTFKEISSKITDATDKTNVLGEVFDGLSTPIDNITDSVKGFVDAIRQQTQAFGNFVGLFDTFQSQTLSPQRLVNRLRAQVKAIQQWQSNLATLEQKGMSQELISTLRAMGPSQAGAIQGLARMTTEQMKEYESLYGTKMGIAGQEAYRSVSETNRADKLFGNQVNITIANSNIKTEEDAEKVARDIIQKLKLAGVRI
jgi:hypothetical protein